MGQVPQAIKTVKDLRKVIASLPDDMPIGGADDCGQLEAVEVWIVEEDTTFTHTPTHLRISISRSGWYEGEED